MISNKYRRSVSFPIPNPSRPSSASSSWTSNHNRSTSLPIPKHLIDHLTSTLINTNHQDYYYHDHDNRVPWIIDSLVKLTLIHDSLVCLLQLPHSYATLGSPARHSTLHKLLHDSLIFVDCFCVLRDCLLELKHELVVAQVALRRKDDSHLGLYLKAQMRVVKNITKLRLTISSLDSFPTTTMTIATTHDHVDQNEDLVQVIGQVHELTVWVSGAVFEAIAGSLSSRKGAGSTSWIASFKAKRDEGGGDEIMIGIGVESAWGLRKNGDDEEMRRRVLNKMREVEEWVDGIQGVCERLFRSLVCTRVSLLNILSH